MLKKYIVLIIVLIFVIPCKSEEEKEEDIQVFDIRSIKERIINGRPAKAQEVPYIVALLGKKDAKKRSLKHFCGGSIIGRLWVITAAHCMKSGFKLHLIRAGSLHSLHGGFTTKPRKIFVHPAYKSNKDNDIALIQTTTAFPSRKGIRIISLSTGSLRSLTNVLAAGWGSTVPGIQQHVEAKYPKNLRLVILKVWNQKECQNFFTRQRRKFDKRHICAGAPRKNQIKDTCIGDSGGPLVNMKNGELVGIVSWGIDCGIRGYPGAYTSILSYKIWIKTVSNIT